MARDETVAVDLHTHGRGPAFWSADDDRDDQGIAVAGVFGLLDQPAPMACFRLVINGLYKTLPRHPWQQQCHTAKDNHRNKRTNQAGFRKIFTFCMEDNSFVSQ